MPQVPQVPSMQREVRLRKRPDGLPTLEDFEVVTVPLPVPRAGEVLVRNRFFQVFASLRMMIGGGADAVEGVPFPAMRPGDTLLGAAVGEVVSAPGSDLCPGALVFHRRGWREYAVVPAADCRLLDDSLPEPVFHLGQGWTAYAAFTHGVEVRPGDTVFVSAAGSAIGSMAGQLARLMGAGRVIGSTSSREKADRLCAEVGYDAVVARDEGLFAEQLLKAAPEGIDVFFDSVGGEQLQAAVQAARTGARFVLIGTLAGQLSPHGTGIAGPVELDGFQMVIKRIQMRGFSADDVDSTERQEWNRHFNAWLRSGDIKFPHVRIAGIERAPQALLEVIAGRHVGSVIVEL